ncbi:TIGR01777 family oxidoreductase [Reichenbachiella carrageenanivorans]|uniref:TIGR01777 family oxidoreductase n=1 Tax=Reichenbachiella carrageenanivorans TaxID=2979869 RepID=A0ABY6D2N7_9BACT|nr:TIGR01777 family oxidoreductase [Reichenbachiella carrageenanivorans]UXX80169.1 TIGR01777 family oxidoreductase [Reichenbachiella carrageenanivorans]
MHVLVTGGTGLIGQRLVGYLRSLGMLPRLVSRTEQLSAESPQYKWSLQNGYIDPRALDGVEVVIHLAGANIAEGRWTDARKKEIVDSRILSTRLLYDAIEKMEKKPKALLCASATGYYGFRDFEYVSDEEDRSGTDFLAQVCVQWETEADRFSALGMRVVRLRTGLVLDGAGGAFPKMLLPVRYYAGAALGSGQQYINWIHWQDWCGAVGHLIEQQELSGAFNLVAPFPVTNDELTRLIARAIERPLWLPNVPAFIFRGLLGEMSAVLLQGHKVSCTKLQNSGYQFKHQLVKESLSELLSQD